ncbi:MAG: nucleotidyltransferase domain-containing protein, partial [Candidatus Njordarchaeota archaeon]
MPRTHVEKFVEREIIYDKKHWTLLESKRSIANDILKYLARRGIKGYIFGSVARGDVHKNSDVEIIVLEHSLLSIIDIYLSQGFNIVEKEIIQATPNSALKALFHLDNMTLIVVPIVPLSRLEYEFYKYGGIIGLPSSLD